MGGGGGPSSGQSTARPIVPNELLAPAFQVAGQLGDFFNQSPLWSFAGPNPQQVAPGSFVPGNYVPGAVADLPGMSRSGLEGLQAYANQGLLTGPDQQAWQRAINLPQNVSGQTSAFRQQLAEQMMGLTGLQQQGLAAGQAGMSPGATAQEQLAQQFFTAGPGASSGMSIQQLLQMGLSPGGSPDQQATMQSLLGLTGGGGPEQQQIRQSLLGLAQGQTPQAQQDAIAGLMRTVNAPIGSDPSTQQAMQALTEQFQSTTTPQIQNQMALAGLGRSGALGDALAQAGQGLTAAEASLLQGEQARRQSALQTLGQLGISEQGAQVGAAGALQGMEGQQITAANALANLSGMTQSQAMQALESVAGLAQGQQGLGLQAGGQLAGLGGTLAGRPWSVANQAFGLGEQQRQVQQLPWTAAFQDMLRQQGLGQSDQQAMLASYSQMLPALQHLGTTMFERPGQQAQAALQGGSLLQQQEQARQNMYQQNTQGQLTMAQQNAQQAANMAQQNQQAQFNAAYNDFLRRQDYTSGLMQTAYGIAPATVGQHTVSQNQTGGLLGSIFGYSK